jgi:hypothetical protein
MTGFSISAVKFGLTKFVLNLKDLLITIYVTSVKMVHELMLILNH